MNLSAALARSSCLLLWWRVCRHRCGLIFFFTWLGASFQCFSADPAISSAPQSITNATGSTAVFSATVTGTQPLIRRWQKDGLNLSDNGRISGTASNILTLVGVQPADAGGYRLVVTNGSGAATSAVATLTISVPEQVTFSDASLESALRGALNKPTGSITPADLAGLASLSACGQNITDLSGLEWATNLSSLSLSFNSITNLIALEGLKRLAQLNLENNRANNLQPLAGVTSLNSLNVGGNSITNANLIAGLTNLTALWLQRNPLSNVGALTNLTALKSLALFSSGVADISPLAGLTNLNYLELRWNPLTNAETVLANLTNLTTLYLGGTGVSNVTFLQNCSQLSFLNLDHAGVTNLIPLAALPALRDLDAGYNPLADLAALASFTNLDSLGLSGDAISNVSALTGLNRLRALRLHDNQITNLAPLMGLTNLSELAAGKNPLTIWTDPNAFTNLACLWLDGVALSNVTFMQNLPALEAVGLRACRQKNLSAMAGLTNMVAMFADQNLLTNIDVLPGLSRLARVQLTGNLLDLTTSAPPATVVDTLRNRGAAVLVVPQNQPPSVTAPAAWVIATNSPATLLFNVSDDTTPAAQLIVTVQSANTNLISTTSVLAAGTPNYRALSVTPVANQTGTTTLTLTVSDDAGLFTNLAIAVTVIAPQTSVLTDTNLAQSIAWTLGYNDTNFNSVTLGELTRLTVTAGTINSLGGLQWATNLTQLEFTANTITHLGALQSLTKLQSLTVHSSSLLDGSALASLTNLTSLILDANSITNLDFLQNLRQLVHLTLSTHTITNYQAIAGLTNLTTLDLSDDFPGDLGILTTLTRLISLDLAGCRLTNAAPLSALTNLQLVLLERNRLADMSALTNLPALAFVDVSYNRLNPTGNPALTNLLARGVTVIYLPQRGPPSLVTSDTWLAFTGLTSYLRCSSWDEGGATDEYPTVTFISASTNLLPGTNLFATHDLPLFPNDWILAVTPPANFTGTNVLKVVSTSVLGLAVTNSITLIVNQPLPLNGSLLNDTNLVWQSGGGAPWFGQTKTTHDGVSAAQSGGITDAQESWIQTTVTGPRQLSFWWKVSSEPGYDYLEFYTNNVRLNGRITGEEDWSKFTLNLPVGTQTLRWRYYKDSGFSYGDDAAWLDEVTLKAPASITLTNLSQTYDGNAHPVAALTSPNGLTVSLTYDGGSSAPTNTGTYQVIATINDSAYYGATTNTLIIGSSAPFVILSLTGAGTTNAVITWTSISNRIYELQYQSIFGGNWQPVVTNITATNLITAARDTSGASDQRFYRVMQLAVIAPAPYTNGPPVILSLTGAGTSSVTLTWSSVSNFNYRALYASSLAGPWTPLTADIHATNATTSAIDPSPAIAQRFYRVMVVIP